MILRYPLDGGQNNLRSPFIVTLIASVPPVSSAGVATRGDLRPWSDSVLEGARLDFLQRQN